MEIEGIGAYDGYKYPASGMINFLLFVRLCRFKTREDGLEFLERHKGWAMALGFNNGVPNESDVTKFVNFNEDGFELEFNVKKTKEKYYEHIVNIVPVGRKVADGLCPESRNTFFGVYDNLSCLRRRDCAYIQRNNNNQK